MATDNTLNLMVKLSQELGVEYAALQKALGTLSVKELATLQHAILARMTAKLDEPTK